MADQIDFGSFPPSVDREAVLGRIAMACDVLAKKGFASVRVNETRGDGALIYEFALPTTAAEAAEVEDAIVQSIVERPYSPVDSAVVFYCVPAPC